MSRRLLAIGALVIGFYAGQSSTVSAQAHRPQLAVGGTVGFAGRLDNEFNIKPMGDAGARNQFQSLPLIIDREIHSYDATPTYGLVIRYEHPVHRYVSLGVAGEFYRFKSFRLNGLGDRDFGGSLSPTLRAGYPFITCKRKRKVELYGRFQFGFSLTIEGETGGETDRWEPGFNTALAAGAAIELTDHFGLFFEMGWVYVRTYAEFRRLPLASNPNLSVDGDHAIVRKQPVATVGVMIPL